MPSVQEWKIAPANTELVEAIATMQAESFKAAYLRGDGSERDHNVQVEAKEFLTPERLQKRKEVIERSLTNPEDEFYRVAYDDKGFPIGLMYGFKKDDMYEILALYVAESYFGKGVGKELMKAFREWADPNLQIELGVVTDNIRAQKFYKKMGFQALGDTRESYYPYLTETTMVMTPQQGGN